MPIRRYLIPVAVMAASFSAHAAPSETVVVNPAPLPVVVKPAEQPVHYYASQQFGTTSESYPSMVFQDYHVPQGNQFRLRFVGHTCHSYGAFGELMAPHVVVNGLTVASFRTGTVLGRTVTSGDTVDILLSPGDAVHVVLSRTGATQGICNTFINGVLQKL